MAGKTTKVVAARKTKKTKKRANKQKKARKGGGMSNMGAAGQIAKQVCALTDPFCPASYGVKYPDSASTRSLAWTMESFATLTTDSGGRGVLLFGTDPNYGQCAALTFTTNMVIATTSVPVAYPGWAQWASTTGVQYRPVSFGVEARSILSAMNNQGSIGIAVVPASTAQISTPGLDLDGNYYSKNVRTSSSSTSPITAIAHDDGETARLYRYSTAPGANGITVGGWDCLAVYMVGGPASTPSMQVRVIIHYELTFASGSAFNQVATPSAVENNAVQTGSNFVKRTIDQVIVGGSKEVERRVHSAANLFGKYMISRAAGALGTYFGGPGVGMIAAGGAGMLMDVD